MATTSSRGVILIHSAATRVCPTPRVGGGTRARPCGQLRLGRPAGARRQPSCRVLLGEVPVGTGAALASAIRGWEHLRFEVSEDPTPRSDGGRWMHTPGSASTRPKTESAGNVVIGEDRVRYAVEVAAGDAFELQRELDSPSDPPGTTSSNPSATRATTSTSSGCTTAERCRVGEAPLPEAGDRFPAPEPAYPSPDETPNAPVIPVAVGGCRGRSAVIRRRRSRRRRCGRRSRRSC